MIFNNSTKNSKGQLKIPPNNINININFNVKDNKQLIGKKIDNVVHVSHNSRQQLKKPNFFLDNNKQKKSNLQQFQSDQNQLMKTKKLDIGEKIKIKERSAKTSRPNNQYIPSSFSTNRLKYKNCSKQLRDIFTKGKKIDDNSGPTPIKILPTYQDKQKNKSNQKIKKRRAISNQKVKLMKKTPISLSVQNLRRAKQLLEKTPSKSSPSRSNSKNNKFHIQPILLQKTIHSKQNETKRTKIYNQIENIKQESSKKNSIKKSRKSTQKLQSKINQIYKINIEQNNQKKRKVQKQKQKKQDEQKLRQDKSNKYQKERKSNLKLTKSKIEKKNQQSKQSKKLMNNLVNQQKQYQRLKQEAIKLLNLNSKEQYKNIDQRKPSKKNKKEIFTNNLIEKYFNHTIDQKEYQKLQICVIKIQKVWRGYKARKQFLQNLQSIQLKIADIRENIDNKNQIFWGNNSNSIIQIQNSIDQTQSIKTQRIFSERLQPQDNSSVPQPDNVYAQGYDQFDTEQAQQMNLSNVMKMIQTLQKSSKDSKLSKQLKFLKEAMLKQEQEKNKVLKQNYQLKENMKQLIKQQQNNLIIQNSKQFKKTNQESDAKKTFDSLKINNMQDSNEEQQFVIRMPVKINNQKQNKQTENIQKIELKIVEIADKVEIENNSAQKQERKRQIQNLKKFKLQSDNLLKKSKKNNLFIDIIQNQTKVEPIIKKQNPIQTIVTKLTSPKYQQPNLLELLKQKQKILNDKHKKSQQVITNMYQNKLVSPRSYNYKLNQLQKIIEKQRKSIQRSLKEAQKITNLIKGMQKDKQQIKGLQKLSKEQRWNDAINIIDDFSEMIQSDQSKQEQNQNNIKKSIIPKIQGKKTQKNFQQKNFHQKNFHYFQEDEQPNNVKKQEEKRKTIMSIFQQKPYSSNSSQESITNNHKIQKQKKNENENENEKQINDKDIHYEIIYHPQKGNKNIQEGGLEKIPNNIKFEQDNESSPEPPEPVDQQIQQQAEKPGFETNLNFVKQYCIGLCEYIRSKPQYKQEFKQKILTPISYNLSQFLKCYRQTLNNQYTNDYNSFKKQLIYPYYKIISPILQTISQDIFQEFNQTFTKLKIHSPRTSKDLIVLEKYHLKSLLSAFNQALDYERPSSIYGKPLPWANNSKHLKNINSKFQEEYQMGVQYTNQDKKLDQIFGVAIARVIQWGSSLCGFIPQSLELEKGQVLQIDEEYVNHIKETRMALMLQKNLAQEQEKMLQFSQEQTEVKLQSAQKILDLLIRQLAQEMLDNYNRKEEQAQNYFQFID